MQQSNFLMKYSNKANVCEHCQTKLWNFSNTANFCGNCQQTTKVLWKFSTKVIFVDIFYKAQFFEHFLTKQIFGKIFRTKENFLMKFLTEQALVEIFQQSKVLWKFSK